MNYVFNKYTNYLGNINKVLIEPFLKKDLVSMSNLVNEKYFIEIANLTNSHTIAWCVVKCNWNAKYNLAGYLIKLKFHSLLEIRSGVLKAHYHRSGRLLKFLGRLRGGNDYYCT